MSHAELLPESSGQRARNLSKHPTMIRTALTTKNSMDPNALIFKCEKPWGNPSVNGSY